jgi:hypothetical protein
MPGSGATPPDALLLIAPGCAHCPAVLAALAELVKRGELGRLEVTNIAVHPDAAEARGVRSVPWIRIGAIELEGAHTPGELALWAQRAQSEQGFGQYLGDLLATGRMDSVTRLVTEDPRRLRALIGLIASLDTPMAARIGVGAVLEDLAGSASLQAAIAPLRQLLRAEAPQIRADACHYLGLTGDPGVAPDVEPLLDDPDAEVREIARETLDALPSRAD